MPTCTVFNLSLREPRTEQRVKQTEQPACLVESNFLRQLCCMSFGVLLTELNLAAFVGAPSPSVGAVCTSASTKWCGQGKPWDARTQLGGATCKDCFRLGEAWASLWKSSVYQKFQKEWWYLFFFWTVSVRLASQKYFRCCTCQRVVPSSDGRCRSNRNPDD